MDGEKFTNTSSFTQSPLCTDKNFQRKVHESIKKNAILFKYKHNIRKKNEIIKPLFQ